MERLEFGITSRFSTIFTTQGTGADEAIFYRPIPADGYYIIGHYGQGNLDPASGTIVTVTVTGSVPGQPSDDPLVKPPDDFRLIWNGTSMGIHGSFWQPVAPPNFVALGTVAQSGINKPVISDYRCLRFDQVKSGSYGAQIWSHGGSATASVYQIMTTNTFFAQADLNPPTAPVWVPKDL